MLISEEMRQQNNNKVTESLNVTANFSQHTTRGGRGDRGRGRGRHSSFGRGRGHSTSGGNVSSGRGSSSSHVNFNIQCHICYGYGHMSHQCPCNRSSTGPSSHMAVLTPQSMLQNWVVD